MFTGLALGFGGYLLWRSFYGLSLVNDGSGGGFIDAVTGDLNGAFLTVSNVGQGLNMNLSIALLGYLKGWEKYKPTPYYATEYERAMGKQTIGYGHVIKPGENLTYLTETEATGLLLQDVNDAVSAVNRYVKISLTQNQFDALVSFAFNCGAGALAKVAKTVNAGGNVPAHIMRYVYQGQTVLPGLVNRRTRDVAIWTNGEYSIS